MERLFARSRWGGDSHDFSAQRDTAEAVATGPLRMLVQFTAVRRGVNIVPSYDARTDLPPALMQSAIVVGPVGEEVYCDRMGRVKIRFPGTRPADHEQANGAGTLDTEADSAWVRVVSNWAGNGPGSLQQCGTVALPRIGTEVLVNFLGGDPDKPVIVGQLYNEVGEPAALSSLGNLPGNRYLSGMKSSEIHGTRVNQLCLDDTQGQISAHLSSDHGDTQLNLGFLTSPRSEGAGEARGEGAELYSEEQIALRAAKGMLLSAWEHVGSNVKQMDRKEFQLLMTECMDLAKSLGELASRNNAKPLNSEAQQQLCEAFESWESGSNTEPRAAESEKPMIAMTSPSGISIVTANDLVSYAATNQNIIAQQNLQLTAGQSGVINAGKGISLFSQSEGIDVIAHKGRLLLQSQQDHTELNAAKDLKFTATEGKIIGMAKEIILVAEDGSFIKIGDGITLGTTGTITHHGASFPFKGPSSIAASLPKFEHDTADIKFQARYYPNIDGGIPAPDVTVISTVADGEEVAERSNQEGRTELIARDAMLMVSAVAMRTKKE